MIKLTLLAFLITIGNHSIRNNKSSRSEKYIDIDEIPKANIEFAPVFLHKTPDLRRKNDTLKYKKDVYSIYKWLGKEDEPLGPLNVYSFAFYAHNKPLFSKDSIYMHNPIHVSKDSSRFLFSYFNSIDGEETPYGSILFADIRSGKTISIEALKPVDGPFINNGHSFVFAEDNTVYCYDIAANTKKTLFHMVSLKPFTIINLKILDDNKTLRVMLSNDEGEDHTCTGMDIDLGSTSGQSK
jgi:hypothetical protein